MNEDDYLLISGIKHFRFCKRRWALIHIEQEWAENALTVSGQIMHETVHDAGFTEKRGRLLLSRGMPIRSEALHIQGVCDMVELIEDEDGVPIRGREGRYRVYPVEYKHGKPDSSGADLWHLCAEVLCLEEMFVTEILEGAIYYGELRRRETYAVTEELRREVREAIAEMNDLMHRGHTPKVRLQKACVSCSMREICQPNLGRKKSARNYIRKALTDE